MLKIARLGKASTRVGLASGRGVGSFDLIMSILLKLTSLAIRTVAKPIGTLIKAQAKEHARFRKGCVYLAQNLHRLDVNLKIKLLGQKNIKVRPLNENKAIENGANFISESFIFGVAGSLILYESYRQRKKELSRREAVADDISLLQDEIEFLKKSLSLLSVKFEEYKPSKQYHPMILKIGSNDEVKPEETPSLEATNSNIINLILTKMDDKEVNLLQKNDTLKVKDKKLFADDEKDKIVYLKVEKIID